MQETTDVFQSSRFDVWSQLAVINSGKEAKAIRSERAIVRGVVL